MALTQIYTLRGYAPHGQIMTPGVETWYLYKRDGIVSIDEELIPNVVTNRDRIYVEGYYDIKYHILDNFQVQDGNGDVGYVSVPQFPIIRNYLLTIPVSSFQPGGSYLFNAEDNIVPNLELEFNIDIPVLVGGSYNVRHAGDGTVGVALDYHVSGAPDPVSNTLSLGLSSARIAFRDGIPSPGAYSLTFPGSENVVRGQEYYIGGSFNIDHSLVSTKRATAGGYQYPDQNVDLLEGFTIHIAVI